MIASGEKIENSAANVSWLGGLSIRNKLIFVLMLVSVTAVVVACTAFISASFFLHRQELQRDIRSLAMIVGNNSRASLSFDMPEDAEGILSGLSADETIIHACILDSKGDVFASYNRGGFKGKVVVPSVHENVIKNGILYLFHDVVMNDEVIATICISDDMSEVYAAVRREVLVLAIISVITLVLVYFLSARLQKVISGPILTLTDTAGRVTEEKDYSIRAEMRTADEIGDLIGAFNEMLGQIEQRDDELAHNDEVLRGTINSTADGILAVDQEGRILTSNARFVEMWGISPALMAKGHDRNLIEFVREQLENPEEFKARIEQLYGSSAEGFEEINLKDGRVFERFTCPLIRDEVKIGRVWNFRDITVRKKEEVEKEKLLHLFEAKNQELQGIVYVTSHDLRSPLVNIHGFSGELRASCTELKALIESEGVSAEVRDKFEWLIAEDIPESLGFIMSSAGKMSGLLDGLLQVSRIGNSEIEIIDLDMNAVVGEVVKCTQFQIAECEAEVFVDDLVGCIGDAKQVNQIFSNLIGNSIKYRDTGRKLEIRVSSEVKDDSVIYAVSDNGLGIDQAYHGKIFEIFHQLDPNSKAGGEGLGLTIIKRIVDRLDGHIWVESEAGKGSCFYVSLPRVM
jgi:PAS domain S-box-containing protein